MMLLLKCPKCKNEMKYHTRSSTLTGKRKVCVYCGFSMGVSKALIRQIK
jgi:predicted RNA-binding Zn-ribbon protein involved in translation (DUF1610 family)